ncbi:MAG TPA: spore germination protein [Bacillota bacterium]|nr:spore germination protein [Bacillota bacterium]
MSENPKIPNLELQKSLGSPIDLEIRTIESKDNLPVQIAFLRGLADPTPVINALTQHNFNSLTETAFTVAGKVINGSQGIPVNFYLYSGATLIYLPNREPFAIITRSMAKRVPSEPVNESSIRGPRDGFVEDIYDNLSLIRRRLPDPHLQADELTIGRRTQTKVAVVYLEDVANPDLVAEVKKRLAKIDIDGVLEPGILEEFIKDNKLTTLPLSLTSERPDKAAGAILEGRVAIMVDYAPQVIIVPITLNDLYQAPDDHYFDYWAGSLIRIVRFIGNLLAIGLPGLYIALIGSSPQLLPISFGLTVAGLRIGMPFPLYVEVLIAEMMVELLREAGLRLPRGTNQTLGATIGIIIGSALIQTGYISTPTLIVVGISAIASFSSPQYPIGLTWRILKYILIVSASFLGLYGFILGAILITAHIAGLSSFGSPYTAPWGPWQTTGILDSVIRAPHWLRLKRPQAAKPLQPNRGAKYPKE